MFICVILLSFGGENIWVNDRQQAPPHLLFARPRAKVNINTKHDFKTYDASIKDIPCHSLYLWISKCLQHRLERLKSGTTVTPSHHYPTMKHTWSFCNFWNWKHSTYFSSNGTLKSLNGVYILTKGFWICLLFHPTSKKDYVELWVWMNRQAYLHHIILLSQKPDPRRCKPYTLIKKCKYVEIKLFLV